MEGFNLMDYADSSQAADNTVTPKTSEAVDNLIYLSQHASSVSSGNSEEILLHSGPVETVKSVAIIKSTLDDIFKGFKAYRCPLCSETDDDPSNLYNHIKSAHKGFDIQDVDDAGPASPGTCDSSTNRSPKVISVIKTPKADRETGVKHYQCSACDYSSEFTNNVYNHMRVKHSSCQIQVSSQCASPKPSKVNRQKKIFTSGKEVRVLKTAKEDVLKGEKMYRCSACGKANNSTGNLYRHMRRHHKDCSIKMILENQASPALRREKEEKVVKTPGRVVKIIKSSPEEVDRGEKPYKCSECGKGSEYTGNLYAHMDTCHPECTIQYFKAPVQIPSPTDAIDTDSVVRVITVRQNGKLFYKCSKCYLISAHSGNVYKHMRRVHRASTIIKRTGSRKRNDLMEDMRAVGNIEDGEDVMNNDMDSVDNDGVVYDFVTFECSVCMETFSTCDDLDTHVKIHDEDGLNKISDSDDEDDEDSDFGMAEEEVVDDGEALDDRENAGLGEETVCEEIAMKEECAGSEEGGRIGSDGNIANENEGSDTVEGGRNDIYKESTPHEKDCSPLNSSLSQGGVRTLSISENIKNRKIGNLFVSAQCSNSTSLLKRPQKQYTSVKSTKTVVGTRPRYDNSLGDSIVTVIKTTQEERAMGEKYYKCSLCDKASNFTGNLYKHMRSVHWDCTLQKINEDSNHEKEIGESSQHGNSFGERVVEVIVNPANHRQGGKLYSCSECGHTVNCTSNLYNHMHNKHRGFTIQRLKEVDKSNSPRISTSPKFTPLKSSKSDVSSWPRRGHNQSRGIVTIVKTSQQARDMGEKYYKCSLCDKASNFTSNLYKHMRCMHDDYMIQKVTECAYLERELTPDNRRKKTKKPGSSKSKPEPADSSTNDTQSERQTPKGLWDWASDSLITSSS